jgi:hypothetical protein
MCILPYWLNQVKHDLRRWNLLSFQLEIYQIYQYRMTEKNEEEILFIYKELNNILQVERLSRLILLFLVLYK